jgi:fused signal recognition particle receptor
MLDLRHKTEQGIKNSREKWFSKISHLFDRDLVEKQTWDELEELLISADVGVATVDELIKRTKERVQNEKLSEGFEVRSALKKEMVCLLSFDSDKSFFGQEEMAVILVVGVNGSGKTTSIAKLAYDLKHQGKSVVLAAADTFRTAAIDQLKHWGQIVGVDVIAHQPGGDPGAVVYDAVQAGQSRRSDVVIIDTAGRLHTKFNLMEELKKMKRVAAKYYVHLKTMLVLDAVTGQNGLLQARNFTEAVDVTGIFLSKLDGTAKGGIVLAICNELKIPIMFVGIGEQIEDMAPFDANIFVEAILS